MVEMPGAAATRPEGRPVRIGLLGCGHVGSAFVELIDSGAASITRRTGLDLEVTRIAVRDLGRTRPGVADSGPSSAGRGTAGRLTADAYSVVADDQVDLVVELIGGIEPARTLVLSALRAGKPVVTANKELLASAGAELLGAAEAAAVDLYFEASVAGAIPLVRLLSDSLAGERINRVMGIVNGTTNYVLTKMSDEGSGYAEALAEAQALGYAEADPSVDVEGYDARAKAAILAGIAFDADVEAEDVYREGITGIGAEDIAFAHRLGYEVKLLAVAERVGGGAGAGTGTGAGTGGGAGAPGVTVRVHPAMVPAEHPLASVRGSFNAVFVEGESAGEIMIYGRGAGGGPTASAVLGDVVAAAHHLQSGIRGRPVRRDRIELRPMSELRTQYYLTLDVADRPGVLGAVAQVFGDHHVSIRSMEQVGLGDEARLVFITHTALEADVQATLESLAKLEAVDRIGGLLRVIGPER